MKTKNILTEEIVRIMEIMGVSVDPSSIITESIADDLISGGIKLLGDSSDIAKFTKKLSDEYGIPVNTPNIRKQIDEFVKTTNPTRKQEIFINFIDEMDINGIFKISDQLLNTTKVRKMIDDQINAIKSSIESGNFTLPSGKLDDMAINKYINDFINGQIKTNNELLERLADRLKRQINDEISTGIRSSKVGKFKGTTVGSSSTDKIWEDTLYDLETKINSGKGWTKEQSNAINEFKKKFGNDLSTDEYKNRLSNRLEAIIKSAKDGDATSLNTVRKFRQIANEGGGMVKDIIDGSIDSVSKAGGSVGVTINKYGIKGIFILTIAAIAAGVYFGGKEELQRFRSGTYTKGSKLYCWNQNVVTFGNLDSDEQNSLSDATGITCDDFESGDDSIIPKMVKKLTSKNTGKLYYVVTYKNDRIEKYDENFKKVTSNKKSEDDINTTTERSKTTPSTNDSELLNRFERELKEGWADALTGKETFRKEDNLYLVVNGVGKYYDNIFIVNDGVEDFYFEYENGEFKELIVNE